MTEPKSKNIKWHSSSITADERAQFVGQPGAVVWFTGLSGSGKSTLARATERLLLERQTFAYVLDGDNLRFGLNADLGFSAEDRTENIRRVGCVAQLMSNAGLVCITAFISPYAAGRDAARKLVGDNFIEVHVATPLEVCETRDPKGLYAKARSGEITNFTGISAPYEEPAEPELRLVTKDRDPEACAAEVVALLESRSLLRKA
jgi:adenylylsulfate kinase